MSSQQSVLEERWVDVNGTPLFYREGTSLAPLDATPIIHIHGFAISGRYLLPTAERLARFYPTYVPDLPGFGRSPRWERSLSIPDLAGAVRAFMDAVGLERAVLLGNSLGGPIIIEFADQYPDRIAHAVLVSPAGGANNLPMLKGVSQLALDGLREPLRLIPIASTDYLRYGFLRALSLFHAMAHYPVADRAKLVKAPTLVVIGERDPLVSEHRILKGVRAHEHIMAVRIRGAAHAINFSHPDELAHVVRAFLEERAIADDPEAAGEAVVIA